MEAILSFATGREARLQQCGVVCTGTQPYLTPPTKTLAREKRIIENE